MNAILDAAGNDTVKRLARTPAHATSKFKLLLKREFWENKGGFFWAPIWAGGISLFFTLITLLMGEFAARKSATMGGFKLNGDVVINGLDLAEITRSMSANDMEKLSNAVSIASASAMFWPMLVLGFVVFFYCLGNLFDERKDRSVLFWKSLPVSDRDTVLSKAVSALVVAPVMALGVGIACMFGFLIMLSVFVLIHHGNPFTLLWSPSNLLSSMGIALAALPLYALWALPSVAWLMLCSVWAKSKPFLWAIMLPVFTGVLISWFDLLSGLGIESSWFWKNIVAHLLGGVFPGTWMTASNMSAVFSNDTPPSALTLLQGMYTVLGSPQLWIGAVAGAAMIFAAIRLRRWRDDN